MHVHLGFALRLLYARLEQLDALEVSRIEAAEEIDQCVCEHLKAQKVDSSDEELMFLS